MSQGRANLAAALQRAQPRRILVIDPDKNTAGAAYWAQTREDGSCWVWGGDKGGAPLVDPRAAQSILAALTPDLVMVEAPISGGGAFARSMHPQNVVRGGWLWLAGLAGIPVVQLAPASWQPSVCKDKGPRKPQYKAHARAILGGPVNEDAAAALCMLEFALGIMGRALPHEIKRCSPC